MYGAGFPTGVVSTEYVVSDGTYVPPTTSVTTEYVTGAPMMSHNIGVGVGYPTVGTMGTVGTTYMPTTTFGTTYVQPTIGTTYIPGGYSTGGVVEETVYRQY